MLDDPPVGPPPTRALVTQSRMTWTFARVHRLGYSDANHDYGTAAAEGYQYLMARFWDSEHGGAFWAVGADGRPVNPRKMMYGQAFGIYALVEVARATGDREPLEQALRWFRRLRERAYDRVHGAWIEHFERDWTPLPLRDPAGIPEVAGLKSANTHLHLMEAFTELYAETRDPDVRAALEESLRINREIFYPAEPGRSCFHRHPDWSPVADPRHAGLSYGHNVEFGWLMLEAEHALGWPRSVEHLRAISIMRCDGAGTPSGVASTTGGRTTGRRATAKRCGGYRRRCSRLSPKPGGIIGIRVGRPRCGNCGSLSTAG